MYQVIYKTGEKWVRLGNIAPYGVCVNNMKAALKYGTLKPHHQAAIIKGDIDLNRLVRN